MTTGKTAKATKAIQAAKNDKAARDAEEVRHKHQQHENLTFLRRFIRTPRQVGSVIPSSRFLTQAMLNRVDWTKAINIAELGAGTGVFTREIVKRARPDAKILVFEVDPMLRQLVRDKIKTHPGLRLYSDAQTLAEDMRTLGIDKLDFILSSLPFTVLPHSVTERILDSVENVLAPSGHFVAYQYSKIMQHTLELRFSKVQHKRVLLNIPPAIVFDCRI